VLTFYPRWFSDFQARLADIAGGNQMAWPNQMIPVFGCVAAPDDDALHAAGFFDLSQEPVILTISPIDVSYPVPAVDAYRATLSNVSVHDAGTRALIGPGWPQDLPPGIILIHVPGIFPVLMFRAGRFSNRTGQTAAAEQGTGGRSPGRRTARGRGGPARSARDQDLRPGYVVGGEGDQVDFDLVGDGLQVAHELDQLIRSRIQHDDQAEAALGHACGQAAAEGLWIDRVLMVAVLRRGEYRAARGQVPGEDL
jgi:hypothetical protein